MNSSSRSHFYGWRVVVGLGAIAIITQGTAFYLFGIILVPLQHETGWTRGEISGAYSLTYLISGIAGIAVGRLIDQQGARVIMSAGCFAAGGCLVALYFSHELWQLYLWVGVGLGISVAMTSTQAAMTVVANWFRLKRGRAMGIYTGLAGLAPAIYVPVVGWLVANDGWRLAVVAVSVSFFAFALPLSALLIRRRPEDLGLFPDGVAVAAQRRVETPSGQSRLEALTGPAFWTLTASGVFAELGYTTISAHQIAFMIGRGFGPVLAASVVGFVGFASIPGRIIFNLASDRFNVKILLALSISLQGVGIGILLVATSVWWLVAYVAVYGVAFGSAGGLFASMMANHFGRKSYGEISAVSYLVSHSLAAPGPIAAGLLYDQLRSYDLGFAIAVSLYGLSVLAVLLTPAPTLLDSHQT